MQFSKKQKIILTLVYFLIISILFCLPGSAFPSNNFLTKIWFDKWVHIGFFLVLAFLVCWAFELRKMKMLILLLIALAAYGALVEVVQDQLITNRALDLGDWVADCVGAIFGIFIWKWYIKNRPL